MRKLLLLISLSTLALWAADFWEKKKFPDWSDKDVQKMLKDSPWARQVDLRMEGMGGGGGGRGRGGGGGMPRGGGGGGGFGGGGIGGAADEGPGGGGGRGGPGGGGGMDGPPPTIPVMIRWHSALPVRQAVAKARFGNEVANSAEAARMLNAEQTAYIIGFGGLPARALRGNPEQLKSRASLRRKGKEPIVAADVKGEQAEGKANLYFFFPRAGNAIAVEDGDVEVVLSLGPMEIKRKFRLKDMVYEGKLEI